MIDIKDYGPGRLSPNFAEHEIFGSKRPALEQRFLARALAQRLLEPIRSIIGAPLLVTDGARDAARHDALEARGYNPSPTSDHSFLDPYNPHGVGAADIVPLQTRADGTRTPRAFAREEFERIVRALGTKPEGPPWGQLIWYAKRGHLHVSNPRTLWYSPEAITALGLRPLRTTYVQED